MEAFMEELVIPGHWVCRLFVPQARSYLFRIQNREPKTVTMSRTDFGCSGPGSHRHARPFSSRALHSRPPAALERDPHFTAFHPDWKMLDKPPTPASTLYRARSIAFHNGIRYAYAGNVFAPGEGSTYCH
jgi:hypothetical protein